MLFSFCWECCSIAISSGHSSIASSVMFWFDSVVFDRVGVSICEKRSSRFVGFPFLRTGDGFSLVLEEFIIIIMFMSFSNFSSNLLSNDAVDWLCFMSSICFENCC